MSQRFQFDGYIVRPVEAFDRPYIETLIAADIYHCDLMDADFFLKPLPGETAWALENSCGIVLFYFKTTPAVRLAIQFTGNDTHRQRAENSEALLKGLAWLEANLAAANFRQILFETEGPELTIFAQRRLGFVAEPGLMVRPISPLPTQTSQQGAVGTVPTGVQRRGE